MIDNWNSKGFAVFIAIFLILGNSALGQVSPTNFLLTDQGRVTTGDYKLGSFSVNSVDLSNSKKINVVIPITANTGEVFYGVISVNVFIPAGPGFAGYSACVSLPQESFNSKIYQEIPLSVNLPNSALISPPVIQAYVTAFYCKYFNPEFLHSNIVTQPFMVKPVDNKLCKVEDKGRIVPFHAQTESAWASDLFGIPELSKSPGTMNKYGCSVTDLAMLFNSYNIKSTPLGSPENPAVGGFSPILGLNKEVLTPGSLNHAFANYRKKFVPFSSGSVAFNKNNDPIWAGAAEVARAGFAAQCLNSANSCDPTKGSSAVSYKGRKVNYDNSPDSVDQKFVENEICNGNPVMLKFKKAGGGQHFMLATGTFLDDQGKKTFRLNNPGLARDGEGQLQTDLAAKYPSILEYILFRPEADPSMMFIAAPMNVHFVVTDPLGRKAGYNPVTRANFQEIPGASYGDQSINTPAEVGFSPETLVSERYFSSSSDVKVGDYQVEVFAGTDGPFYLDYRSFDASGYMNDFGSRTGTLQAGTSVLTHFKHSTESVPISNASILVKGYSVHRKIQKSDPNSQIEVSGKIIKNIKSAFSIKRRFQFTMGGLSGYTLSVPAAQFKEQKEYGKIQYIYHKPGVEIRLSELGQFNIEIQRADLLNVDPSQYGYIRLEIDSTVADTRVTLKCNKEKCRLSDKKLKDQEKE